MVALFCLSTAGRADASGYHPPFDRAVKEADWIILHRVVSDHAPKDKLINLPKPGRMYGRVFLVRVVRSFKGPFRAGDLLYVWDRMNRSTAGYFLRKGRNNLTFLIQPKRRKYIAKVRVRSGTMEFAAPIRNFSGATGRGRGQYLRGWIRMLELTKVGRRTIPLTDMRKVLAGSRSPALIHYVLTHWTGVLGKRDAGLVKALLTRPGVTAMVSGAALDLLRKKGIGLSVAALRKQLANGPKYARNRMLEQITARNAAAVRDILWQWLIRDENAGLDAMQKLARYQRAYLVRQLRRNRLPFWLDIPSLQSVRMRPQQLGRRYSATAMKLSRYHLVGAGQLVKGKTFSAGYSFYTRKRVWADMIHLVMPALAKMNRQSRELAIAIAHTWGYSVPRRGKTARLGKRGPIPFTLSVRRVPGARYKFMVIEYARAGRIICKKSLKRIAISQGRSSVTSTNSTMGGFRSTKQPRGCFKLAAGTFHSEVIDISSLVKNVRKPGRYQVSVDLLHPYSGNEHGIDGWTGMLYSNRLSVQLP